MSKRSIAQRHAAGESITRLAWEYALPKGTKAIGIRSLMLYEFEAALRKVEAAIRRAKKGKGRKAR
jgi:hypothetical protein